MKMETLKDLYVDQLKDAYSAEKQLLKALPRMAKSASSSELRTAFEDHTRATEEHVGRLERIFKSLEERSAGKKCKAMEGLIEEGKEMQEQDGEDAVIDAGLITAAQKVEHYEIALYGSLRTYAELLGEDEAMALLQETLSEEEETDQNLTNIARELNLTATGGEKGSTSSDEEGDGSAEESQPRSGRSGTLRGSR